MKNGRFFYFTIAIFVILLVILSRKTNGIPLFIGDVFYAVMIYFGCRLLCINTTYSKKILFPLLICYLFELQQLYNAAWIVALRNTTLGHYILGQGFLWSDLVCYTFGVVVAFLIDFKIIKLLRK